MRTSDIDFNLQYYMWISDMLTIFDLIRTNKHEEFSKDEVIEFEMKKDSLIAHFITISNEVAKEFSDYLKGYDFNCSEFGNKVVIDFDYNNRGRYIDDKLSNKIMNFIKDELKVYPF